jgi:hypothetical protein
MSINVKHLKLDQTWIIKIFAKAKRFQGVEVFVFIFI